MGRVDPIAGIFAVLLILLLVVVMTPMIGMFVAAKALGKSSTTAWLWAGIAGIVAIIAMRFYGDAGDAVVSKSTSAVHLAVPAHDDIPVD